MSNRTATLAHFSRGRIRLRVEWLKKERSLLPALCRHFETLSVIEQVEINQRTGSILLLYSPTAIESGPVIDTLLDKLTTAFSPVRVGYIQILQAGNNRMSLAVDVKTPTVLYSKIQKALLGLRGIADVRTDIATGKIDLCYDDTVLAQHVQKLHNHLPGNNWHTLARLFL